MNAPICPGCDEAGKFSFQFIGGSMRQNMDPRFQGLAPGIYIVYCTSCGAIVGPVGLSFPISSW